MLIAFVINSNGVIYIVLTTCMLHACLWVSTTQMYVHVCLLLRSLNEAAGHQIKISVSGRFIPNCCDRARVTLFYVNGNWSQQWQLDLFVKKRACVV